jgi:hypothetical protein
VFPVSKDLFKFMLYYVYFRRFIGSPVVSWWYAIISSRTWGTWNELFMTRNCCSVLFWNRWTLLFKRKKYEVLHLSKCYTVHVILSSLWISPRWNTISGHEGHWMRMDIFIDVLRYEWMSCGSEIPGQPSLNRHNCGRLLIVK